MEFQGTMIKRIFWGGGVKRGEIERISSGEPADFYNKISSEVTTKIQRTSPRSKDTYYPTAERYAFIAALELPAE